MLDCTERRARLLQSSRGGRAPLSLRPSSRHIASDNFGAGGRQAAFGLIAKISDVYPSRIRVANRLEIDKLRMAASDGSSALKFAIQDVSTAASEQPSEGFVVQLHHPRDLSDLERKALQGIRFQPARRPATLPQALQPLGPGRKNHGMHQTFEHDFDKVWLGMTSLHRWNGNLPSHRS